MSDRINENSPLDVAEDEPVENLEQKESLDDSREMAGPSTAPPPKEVGEASGCSTESIEDKEGEEIAGPSSAPSGEAEANDAEETMRYLMREVARLMATRLDGETLATCVRMLEEGATHAEIAAVVLLSLPSEKN